MFDGIGKLIESAKKIADSKKADKDTIDLYKSKLGSYRRKTKFQDFLEGLGLAVLWTVIVVGIIALVVGLFLFGAWLFMLAWNCIATYFGWKVITYPVAIAIAWLLAIVKDTIGGNKTANSK